MKSSSSPPSAMGSEKTRVVVRAATASRLFLLSLIVLFRSLLAPYDTSASINPECLSPPSSASPRPILFPRLASAIERSIVWDSVYFVRIAQCGYEYEQSYAFFPLLPLCLSFLSRTVFAPLIPLIGLRAVLGLSGYVLNNVVFVLAAVYLYRLSVLVLKDSEAAMRASILFCFNPASIFYSSIYSESIYAFLSIGGLYHLMSGTTCFSTFLFALSGLVRSNGVLNAGYISFQTMHRAYDALFSKKNAYLALQVLINGALYTVAVFLPFIFFQVYGYQNICVGKLLEGKRPWCKASVPLLYNFIQSHYWGVGFLRYFHLKQLPNFLLALPILSLAVSSIIYYAKLQPELFFSIGFQASKLHKKIGCSNLACDGSILDRNASQRCQEDIIRQLRRRTVRGECYSIPPSQTCDSGGQGYASVDVLPYVLHLGFMALTAFFVMHVQVATRFLSASPPLYWFASSIMTLPGKGQKWGYLIWAYSVAYMLLGSLLFSNFYPFT